MNIATLIEDALLACESKPIYTHLFTRNSYLYPYLDKMPLGCFIQCAKDRMLCNERENALS